ncbi:hypothetical protein GDO86_016730 [Hymenochirus boettgeri]|uniref:Uncharacterized protein n=1 Tax=Hymenochirus boettgeri TaxID=247094 RepID=A0A8T2IPX4_9PIPI|nr:hypothetical protein GDO86_016730 [Hymenochirus boettgeri]
MAQSPSPESLLLDHPIHFLGFAPHGQHRILHQPLPYTGAKQEMLGKLRNPPESVLQPTPTSGYLMWLQISHLPPLLPFRPDKPYDSAVWRQLMAKVPSGKSPIPPPSRMEGNTWKKFASCRNAWRQEKESPKLRIRSQGRAPPTDSRGNIIPPKNSQR